MVITKILFVYLLCFFWGNIPYLILDLRCFYLPHISTLLATLVIMIHHDSVCIKK